MILDTLEVHLKTDEFTCIKWNSFLKLLYRSESNANLTKISYGHVTKIPRDDSLISEPTTEVNGNNP